MGLGHEKIDVYRLAIGYVAWVYEKADGLTGNHGLRSPEGAVAEEPTLKILSDGSLFCTYREEI